MHKCAGFAGLTWIADPLALLGDNGGSAAAAIVPALMYGTIMLGIATVARYSLSSAAAGITPAAATAAIAADRLLLRDEPIAAAAVHYLDGTWTASTEGDVEAGTAADTINATVPGDIISDLFAAVRLSVCLSVSLSASRRR